MASTADTLNDFTAALLARCVTALGPDVPARQFVSPGPPAYDCDSLIVEVAGIGWEQTTPDAQPGLGRRMPVTGSQIIAAYQIAIPVCIASLDSKGRPPKPATINADSIRANKQVWVLWNALYQAAVSDTDPLFEGPCSKIYLDDAVPIDQSGGLGGWVINVRAQIDGIPAA